MSNTSIQLKKSGVTGNVPVSLEHGELAINYADGKLFYLHANGTIASISTGGGSGSASDSFSTLNVNSTLVFATSPTDILNFTSNNGIAVTADGTSKTINISGKEVFDFAQAAFDKANVGVGSANTGVFAHVDTFTADGTSDTYTLATTPVNQEATLINIDGVTQQKSQYTLSGRNIIFTEVPYVGTKIEITSFSNAGNGIYVVPNVTVSATPGTYGNSTTIPTITVDEYGRVTYASNNTIVVPNDLTANIAYITGVDLGQNTYITHVEQYAQSAYAAANAAGSSAYVQAAFDKANTASSNTVYTQGVDNTQNTHITNVEQYAQAAYASSNTNAGNISIIQGVNLSQNTYISNVEGYSESAYAQANTNSTSISYLTSVNTTQNTNIQAVDNYSHTAYAQANTNATNISIIQAVNLAQNTHINAVESYSQSAFDQGNTNSFLIGALQGVDLSQNTHITNVEQYSESAYAQANAATISAQAAFDKANTVSANTIYTQGVDLWQNTYISNVESYAQSGYTQANTNASNISIIQGVNVGQNTYISNVEQYAESAYAQANATNSYAQSAYNKANTGGTITGPVTITDTTQSSSTSSGALVVDGGVGIVKNLTVGGNAIITGDLTIQGTQYITSTTTSQYSNPIISLHTPSTGYITNNDGYDIGIDYQYYSAAAPGIRVVTGGSANGTYATINISDSGYLAPNSVVTVAGVTPSGFNGTYSVSSSTTGTVSFPLALTATINTTGALGTLTRQTEIAVTGATWIGGGTKEANVSFGGIFSSIVLPVGLSITTTAFNPTGYNTVANITSSGQGWIRFSLSSNPGSYVSGGKIIISQRHAFLGRANDTGYFEFYKSGNFTPANTFEGIYGTVKAGVFLAAPSQSISAADITAGGFIRLPAATIYDNSTAANGIVQQGSMSSFGIVQVSSVNANVTYKNASTVYIAGAPAGGNNVTLTGNTYAFEVASGKSWFGGDIEFHSANGVTFYDGSTQATAAAPYAYSNASFAQANVATISAQAAFNQANSANVLAQSAYNSSNTANTYLQTYTNTVVSANLIAAKSYTDTVVNANVSIIAGVNSYQNTYITNVEQYSQGAYNQVNTNSFLINAMQGVDLSQNTRISNIDSYSQSAYAQANATNSYAQSAYNKANGAVQTAFVNISANGTTYTPSSNNDTFTITSAVANGINIINTASNTIDLGLTTTGVSAQTYGNTTSIPSITVDSYGRITSVSNVAITASSNTGIYTSVDSFTANGTGTTFVLSSTPFNINNTLININGVTQQKSTYTLTGNTIFLSAAPFAGANVEVSYSYNSVQNGTYLSSVVAIAANADKFTANGTGTTFVLSQTPAAANSVIININGVTQQHTNYSLTGNVITFNTAPYSGDNVEITYYYNTQTGVWLAGPSSVIAGTYGSSTAIPSITIDQYGRVTGATTTSITTGTTITDETGSSSTYYPMLSTATTGTISAANTSSTKLYFSPSSGALSATSFNAVSDENEKTNIQLINNALEITENLNGVTYDWVESGLPSAGLIAQDVEKWLPQLVATQNGRKSLNYNGVIGVLVEAVKDLSARVKELESKKPRKKKSLNDN